MEGYGGVGCWVYEGWKVTEGLDVGFMRGGSVTEGLDGGTVRGGRLRRGWMLGL